MTIVLAGVSPPAKTTRRPLSHSKCALNDTVGAPPHPAGNA